ncbi:MAG: hypothetical protein WCD79_07300 [Chthoniobacteraceae bacterium]
MSDESLSKDAIANIQREALLHLERTGISVAKVAETLELLGKEQLSPKIEGRMVEALAGEMQSAYTGFEAVASRLLKVKGIRFEKSGAHHTELLKAVEEHEILKGESTMSVFYDLLGFRHFIRNSYGVDLRNEEVVEKARNLCAIWPETQTLLAKSIHELNQPQASGGDGHPDEPV